MPSTPLVPDMDPPIKLSPDHTSRCKSLRKPIPTLAAHGTSCTTKSNAGTVPILSPTPTRSRSIDQSLPPPYTPLPMERPSAPVVGMSSASPRTPGRFPAVSYPVPITSPALRDIGLPEAAGQRQWRPPRLEMASLHPTGGVAGAGHQQPRTAGGLGHARWASLPSAMPTALPLTARPRAQDDGRDGAGAVKIPSFDHPRDRIALQGFKLGQSFTSASSNIEQSGRPGRGHVHGHKRSLSEKLKRLIIPTLPINRDMTEINENAARSAAFSPPKINTSSAEQQPGPVTVAPLLPFKSAGSDGSRRKLGMISTEHLQVQVHAPERPYRSPGTASFLVKRDGWIGSAHPGHGHGAHRPSASLEARAFIAEQEEKRRESDEGVWEYEAAVQGIEGGWTRRASEATFGTRSSVLVPVITTVHGLSDDTTATQGNRSEEDKGVRDEGPDPVWRGDKWKKEARSSPYDSTGSESSFGTSPVTVRAGDDDVILT